MSSEVVFKCDKCREVIKDQKNLWNGGKPYNIVSTNIKMKIKNQIVEVKTSINLKCGEPMELCDDCAWEILRKFIK